MCNRGWKFITELKRKIVFAKQEEIFLKKKKIILTNMDFCNEKELSHLWLYLSAVDKQTIKVFSLFY